MHRAAKKREEIEANEKSDFALSESDIDVFSFIRASAANVNRKEQKSNIFKDGKREQRENNTFVGHLPRH